MRPKLSHEVCLGTVSWETWESTGDIICAPSPLWTHLPRWCIQVPKCGTQWYLVLTHPYWMIVGWWLLLLNECGPLGAKLDVKQLNTQLESEKSILHTLGVKESVTEGVAQCCSDVLHVLGYIVHQSFAIFLISTMTCTDSRGSLRRRWHFSALLSIFFLADTDSSASLSSSVHDSYSTECI